MRLVVTLVLAALVLGLAVPAFADDPVPTALTLTGTAAEAGAPSTVTVTLLDDTGVPVAGAPVAVERRVAGVWKPLSPVTTDATGRATVVLTLSATAADNTVRATYAGDAGHLPSASAEVAITLLPTPPPPPPKPTGKPVKLPKHAPKPRVHLPTQPVAVGAGANPVISTIPAATWQQMVGRTWHGGCPVGRSQLRLVRVNYWDYQGFRRRGELIANVDVAGQMAAALSDLYRHQLPLRSLVREDRFGWSTKLHGANDYRSMAAGNSSAFNCRGVVGNPRVRSPHSYGRALDLNTWENPYRSAQGLVPNRWWQSRSNKRVAWRSSRHLVVRIMKKHGFRWTYGKGDTQHFDAIVRGSHRQDPRVNPPTPVTRCGVAVCD